MKLKHVKGIAQYWADRTGEATDAYKLPSGEVTYVITGWPVGGKLLHSASPQQAADAPRQEAA